MGCHDAACVAHERCVLATNPALAQEHSSRLRFDHELVSRVGMQAGSGKATAHIRGTGWRWRNLSVFPRMPDSSRPVAGWESASLRTMASAKTPSFGVHLAADYGPKRSNSNRLAGSCLHTFLGWACTTNFFTPTAACAVEFEGRAGFEPAFPQRACNSWTGPTTTNQGASLALRCPIL